MPTALRRHGTRNRQPRGDTVPLPMTTSRPVRVLFAASEVVGFAKTGGLADVAGALPRALRQRGHDLAIVMPFYRGIRLQQKPEKTRLVIPVRVGERVFACRLYQSVLPR